MAIPRNLANIAPHANASSTEFVINDGSADLNFRVESDGDANMLFVDAGNNRVGIGTGSPATKLHVENNSTTVPVGFRLVGGSANTSTTGLDGGAFIALQNLSTTSNTYSLIFSEDAGGNATSGIVFQNNSDANNEGTLAFLTRPSAGSITERGRFNSSGNLQLVNNLSVGNATPTTSGAGITFPATQSASTDANTLDDYEEGTWTPTYFGSSTAGTTTYTSQAGNYTKVGRLVTVNGSIGLSAATGTGQLRIGGFPFTSASITQGRCVPMVNNVNWTGGTYLIIFMIGSDTTCEVFYSADDIPWANQNITNEAQDWIFSMTYVV